MLVDESVGVAGVVLSALPGVVAGEGVGVRREVSDSSLSLASEDSSMTEETCCPSVSSGVSVALATAMPRLDMRPSTVTMSVSVRRRL